MPKHTRHFLLGSALLVASSTVVGWDTKTVESLGVGAPEWQSSYLTSLDRVNEHMAIAEDSLEFIGAGTLNNADDNSRPLIIDLNASYFRRDVFGVGAGSVEDVSIPRNINSTLLEERGLPRPAQFAGLPDFSYTLSDWINKNYLCPSVPDDARAPGAKLAAITTFLPVSEERKAQIAVGLETNFCHAFKGWMGLLNSNHFGTQAKNNYLHYHEIALNRAAYAKQLREALKARNDGSDEAFADFVKEVEMQALTFEGIGQHFFQDRWSSGHMWERWDGADWHSLNIAPLTPESLGPHVHVSALAGLIHGHESITKVPDLMCSPSVITGEAMRWRYETGFGSAGDSLFDGMGDYRYNDVLDGIFEPGTGDAFDIAIDQQRSSMQSCLSAGWAEVIRAFGENSDPNQVRYGALDVPLNFDGQTLGLQEDCFRNWATDESMFLGLAEGLGIRADGGFQNVQAAQAALLGAYSLKLEGASSQLADEAFNAGVESIAPSINGRLGRVVLYAQLVRARKLTPNGIGIAKGGLISVSGVASGENTPDVPDYAEPTNLTELPNDIVSSFEDRPGGDRPGRDKPTMYGFFNRAHIEWWCKADNVLNVLNTLREEEDASSLEACTYISSRIYRGTDERYSGAQAESQLFATSQGDVRVDPICELPLLQSDLIEFGRDISDRNPNQIAPGYVVLAQLKSSPALQSSRPLVSVELPTFGYDSLVNWCRRVPVINLEEDPDDPGALDSENIVIRIDDTGTRAQYQISGHNFGQSGVILIGDPAEEVDWLRVVDWQPERITVEYLPQFAPSARDYAVTIESLQRKQSLEYSEVSHALTRTPIDVPVRSVGHAVLRLGESICNKNFMIDDRAELDEARQCTEIDGNLAISFGDTDIDFDTVDFPILNRVTGNIQVFFSGTEPNREITTLSFPELNSVDGFLNLADTRSIRTLTLPSLETVGGDLRINFGLNTRTINLDNLSSVDGGFFMGSFGSLTSLSLPSLETIGGGLTIADAALLTSIDFPALLEVGSGAFGFSLEDLPALTSVNFNNLTSIDAVLVLDDVGDCLNFTAPSLTTLRGLGATSSFRIDSDQGLCSIDLPSIEELTSSVQINNNPALSSVSFGSLRETGFGFDVFNNPSLTSLSIPSLQRVDAGEGSLGGFSVRANKSLPFLNAPALSGVGRTFRVENNGITALQATKLDTVSNITIVGNSPLNSFEIRARSIGVLTVSSSPMMNSFAVDTDSLGTAFIKNNESLTTFELDSSVVGAADIFNNRSLSQCFVRDFCEPINQRAGGIVCEQRGNASCEQ